MLLFSTSSYCFKLQTQYQSSKRTIILWFSEFQPLTNSLIFNTKQANPNNYQILNMLLVLKPDRTVAPNAKNSDDALFVVTNMHKYINHNLLKSSRFKQPYFKTEIQQMVKFIYSGKATKFCKISTVDLTITT